MEKNLRAPRSHRARSSTTAYLLVLATLGASGPSMSQAPAPAPAPAPAAPARPPAPAPAMATPAPTPAFAVRGFTVSGDNPLGAADTARILQPFVRPDATIDTLQQATAALEAELRKRGFGLHRVALPPQEVGDTVKLEIVTFTIDKVTIEGREMYDEGNIRRTLPELQEGKTPNFRRLAIQTAIANENPNKQVQVGVKESDEPDKINATISVKELRPWTLGMSLSNAGSESSGRDRFTVTAGHTNLFNRDHQLMAAYTTSFEEMDDVKQIGLQYKVPLYELGGVVGASYTKSDVVGNFGTFTSTGAGHTFGLNYTHYLPPEGGRRSYITGAIDDKVFKGAVINNVLVGTDRRSRPITLGYTARTEADTYVWGYNVDFAWNTGSGSNNDLVSYQTEYAGIDTVHFKILRGGVNYLAPFADTWTWGARALYQYSPDALISGEQFGLGGLGSVRGTATDRPIAGDKGVLLSFEVNTPEVFEGLRALAFVDAGWIANNNADNVQRLSSDRLASVGVGLRYVKNWFSASVDYGRIVKGSKMPLATNSASPQKGDDKVYVNLSVRF